MSDIHDKPGDPRDLEAMINEHLPVGSKVTVIGVTPPERCSDCGNLEECRPYGPNGSSICWDCGQKNPEETQRRMDARLSGITLSSQDITGGP